MYKAAAFWKIAEPPAINVNESDFSVMFLAKDELVSPPNLTVATPEAWLNSKFLDPASTVMSPPAA